MSRRWTWAIAAALLACTACAHDEADDPDPAGRPGAPGPMGPRGPAGPDGADGISVPGSVDCPTGTRRFDLAHATLCIARLPEPHPWEDGERACQAAAGAAMCTYDQWLAACTDGGAPELEDANGVWHADDVVDFAFFESRRLLAFSTTCDARPQGDVRATVSVARSVVCCSEFPRYPAP